MKYGTIFATCFLLIGCVQKVWVNPSLTDSEAGRVFYQVAAQCQSYANGSSPYIPPAAAPQGSYSTTTYSGTVTQANNYNNQARYSGTATTYNAPDQNAVANANAQNMASIVSSIQRSNAYSSCMNGNGWQLVNANDAAALRNAASSLPPPTYATAESTSGMPTAERITGYECLREHAYKKSLDIIALGERMRAASPSEVKRLETACLSNSAEMQEAF